MRTATITLLSLAVCVPAGADDTFTQKPVVAPAVARGDAPQPVPVEVATADWSKRFTVGPVPVWIWGATPEKNYFLRTEFDASGVKAAKLKVSADNHVVLYLNGKQVAASDEWQEGAEADVTKLLKDKNELIAEVKNDDGPAGFVLKLVMIDEKGAPKYVVSDEKWTAAEKKIGAAAPKAKRIGFYGEQPWGKTFDIAAVAQSGSKVASGTFVTLPGFQVERLFTVPAKELGSWVNLTADDKGRLIASDQDGKGLVRIMPGKVGTDQETKVERIPAKVTAAQGLLWHKNALYVVCNGGPGSGLYRVTSSRNNDVLDKVEKLKAINGGGEHGPHAVRLAPDGKSLYVICGNHTQPPEKIDHSRVPKNWSEDHLLPRQWDAGGHARGILAPGGYVAKTDFEGKTWEMVTTGYRNPFDFAFNADGDMFVYDADMEWDMGMPWYRPTRVNHATSGSELGWRSGTGKWPAYYVDSLPAMVDIGPGSPVGVEFGYGAKFPAQYQKALFICDWTFGTMYAVHLTPSGATFKATKEEFLSRTPLPLTDVCISRADGAMYFVIGGRGAQSELFRVTYIGKEPTEPVEYKTAPTPEHKLLTEIEALHARAADPAKAVAFLVPLLGHTDRFIRYAARVALEHQPVKEWQSRVLTLTAPDAVINGVLGLARQGEKGIQSALLAKLGSIDLTKLDERQTLDLLRTYQVAFTRTGEPDKETAAKLAAKLDPLFPAGSDSVNRELAQLLVYLKSPTIVAKVCDELKKPSKPLSQEGLDEVLLRNRGYGGDIAKMLKNAADQQKLSYLFTLRNATVGWNMDRWKVYYGFLAEARSKNGGASYQGFLSNIEKDAFANATDTDRLAIEAAKLRPAYKAKELPKPIGPGKAWATADVVALEGKLKSGRNFKNGERAFAAARCVVCHRFGGDGGATGPDLSQVAGRFGLKDLAESIVEPSKIISDQYAASQVTTTSGKSVTGKIVNDSNGKVVIVTDPEDSSKTVEINKDDVEEVRRSKISLMPEKLIDGLNENEVLDLIAYLLSRGDPNHAMFKR
ncbi:c-type cytochrome [Frigoriglobus tundricola]|uniref:Beta-propeller-type glycoside hydrolase n=1 Tax=Frigoriglobus tundricola TaxID=2774151 RepID=A0A6M5Z3R0_9BACT|nr:c-type cytochrome [Frigoriglobus tundricola]QJX01038.1 beta-propeller-type glycoside hydrolase [Frigoriglobus tundricola]